MRTKMGGEVMKWSSWRAHETQKGWRAEKLVSMESL